MMTPAPFLRRYNYLECFLLLFTASVALAQTANSSDNQGNNASLAELEILAQKHQVRQKHEWNSYRLLTEHGNRALPIALAGVERYTTNHSWGAELAMIFADDRFHAKDLQNEKRKRHFFHSRDYLRRGISALENTLKRQSGNDSLREQIHLLESHLAFACLESGDNANAEKLSRNQ